MPEALTVDRLHQLITPPKRTAEVDFMTLLQALFEKHYTGSVTLHFADGRAKIVEFPPVQVSLTQI